MSALAVDRMAKASRKNPEGGPEAQLRAFIEGEIGPEPIREKMDAQMKLSRSFKEKLQDVAAYSSRVLGREVSMGEIVEKMLAKRVNLFHLVALRLRLAQTEAEAQGETG